MKRFKKILTSIISMVLVVAIAGTGCAFATNTVEKKIAPTIENAVDRLGCIISNAETVESIEIAE